VRTSSHASFLEGTLRLTRRTFFLPAGRSEGLGPVPLTLLPVVFPTAFLLTGQGNGICRTVWASAKAGIPALAFTGYLNG